MTAINSSEYREISRDLLSAKSETNKVALFLHLLKVSLLKDAEEFIKIEDSVRKNEILLGRVDLSVGRILIV